MKVNVNIAVMDYNAPAIRIYHVKLNEGWTDEDALRWLMENTNYTDAEMYYMCTELDITVEEY